MYKTSVIIVFSRNSHFGMRFGKCTFGCCSNHFFKIFSPEKGSIAIIRNKKLLPNQNKFVWTLKSKNIKYQRARLISYFGGLIYHGNLTF